MNPDRDRDRLLEDALKHELRAGLVASPTPDCLDAETLAAWTDGGLDAQASAMAEAHVSSCARCQAIAGTLAQPIPALAGGEPRSARLWRWWLAPLAASAAAVLVWMVVPEQRQPVDVALLDRAVAVAPPPAEPAPQAQAAKERALEFDESKRKAEALMKADAPAAARDRAEPRAKEEQTNLAAAAPPSVAQLRMQQRVVGEVASADNLHRWRPIGTGIVEYSADGGRTWRQVLTGIDAEITTGSSPSPTVCWMAGRGGVVLLAIDGITFTRLPFPERVDLTAVTATDARIALVTTVDGRLFRTDDSGRTWRRQ